MSDIQPGDVVVCVDDRLIVCQTVPWMATHVGGAWLAVGRVYRVASIGPSIMERGACVGRACRCVNLIFEGGGQGTALRFRKLNDEPDNIEIVERIKACKPINSPVSA